MGMRNVGIQSALTIESSEIRTA